MQCFFKIVMLSSYIVYNYIRAFCKIRTEQGFSRRVDSLIAGSSGYYISSLLTAHYSLIICVYASASLSTASSEGGGFI